MTRKSMPIKEIIVSLVKRTKKVTLVKRTKKEHYGDLDNRNFVDSRTFWRTVRPFLFNISIENEKIVLVEKEYILTNDSSGRKVLNNFFLTLLKQ